MKKSLLILSMLALSVTSARAYDTLEPGTADAPNYYTISANRGATLLTYSYDGVAAGYVTTHLYRQEEVKPAAIWAVTPGEADGTVRIQNLESGRYLMSFQNSVGQSYALEGAVANTSIKPQDIYYTASAGTVGGEYMLSIVNANAWAGAPGGGFYFYGLDASGGSSLCGNYFSGGGIPWGFTKIDMDTQYPNYLTDIKPELDKYLPSLMGYMENVPPVTSIMSAAIAEITAIVEASEASSIKEKYDAAIESGNTAIATGLTNRRYALKSLRREEGYASGCFLDINEAGDSYGVTPSVFNKNAWFTFGMWEDGKYYIHNVGTGNFMNSVEGSIVPGSGAFAMYPILYTFDGYSGVAFPLSAEHTGNGLHMTTTGANPLMFYSIEDAGSVWALVDVQDLEAYMSMLTSYAAGVGIDTYSQVFTQAYVNLENNTATNFPVEVAHQCLDQTVSQVNTAVQTGLDGKVYAIKNLRRDLYIMPKGDETEYTGTSDLVNNNTWFKFTSDSENKGGYFIQNIVDNKYISSELTPSDTPATFYPFISNGSYSGTSFFGFAISNAADHAGNTSFNYNGKLLYWSGTDFGSIWSLIDVEDEVRSTAVLNLEQYVPNVTPAAKVFSDAINSVESLEFNAEFNNGINSITTKAIADANEVLKAGLNGKFVSLRSLRNGNVNAGDGSFTISAVATQDAEDNVDNCYDFISQAAGGYILRSVATKKYVGPVVEEVVNEQTGAKEKNVKLGEESEAITVYPKVYNNGDYYGVAFPLTDSDAAGTTGLNANARGLHTYQINDGGSIFAIDIKGETTEIAEVEATASAAEGIYDLSGRRLSAPVRGINIINGRKVLVK